MITQDVIVYCLPGGQDYAAMDEDGQWWTWPATQHGWLSRRGAPPSVADDAWELSPELGDLALRLSGVE